MTDKIRKRKRFKWSFVILIMVTLVAVGFSTKSILSNLFAANNEPVKTSVVEKIGKNTNKSENEIIKEKIEEYLTKMTLEEKVAQLFIILPEALMDVDLVTAAGNATKEKIDAIPVGGFIYLSGNLENSNQVKTMLKNIQIYSNQRIHLPAFLCVDEEGGLVARVGNNKNFIVPTFERMNIIGARKNSEEAYKVGQTIGTYLSDLGFNVDFAPVADVLTNDENTVVRTRSFGRDPELVKTMAANLSKGLKSKEMLTSYKHFPGHGNTAADTHDGYAYSNKTKEELMKCELIPFKDGIANKEPFMMVGHFSLPKVTGDNTPASLSKIIVTDLLRKELGYEGIIITDALNMGAIVNQYPSEQATLKALAAGVDVFLMPENFKVSYKGVLDAVRDGRVSKERIDDSLRRVLKVKLKIKSYQR